MQAAYKCSPGVASMIKLHLRKVNRQYIYNLFFLILQVLCPFHTKSPNHFQQVADSASALPCGCFPFPALFHYIFSYIAEIHSYRNCRQKYALRGLRTASLPLSGGVPHTGTARKKGLRLFCRRPSFRTSAGSPQGVDPNGGHVRSQLLRDGGGDGRHQLSAVGDRRLAPYPPQGVDPDGGHVRPQVLRHRG